MAALMSEQLGSDSFVDGSGDSDETRSSLAQGFILIAKRTCIENGEKTNSPELPPDRCEPALC